MKKIKITLLFFTIIFLFASFNTASEKASNEIIQSNTPGTTIIKDSHEGQGHGISKIGNKSVLDFVFSLKYIIAFILGIAGIILLKYNLIKLPIRIGWLFAVFILYGTFGLTGIFLSLFPSPICGFTKPFLFGIKPHFMAIVVVILFMSIIGTKLFCGKICPAGALQELFYHSPILKKQKQKKVSFALSNSIRGLLIIVFGVGIIAGDFIAYEYYNLFDLFHWTFSVLTEPIGIIFLAFLILVIGFSTINYRPFCYFICPVGFVTWLLEQISIFRIKFNKDKCNNCNLCLKASPCPAIKDILAEKKLRADCHLCGVCIDSCKNGSLTFGVGK